MTRVVVVQTADELRSEPLDPVWLPVERRLTARELPGCFPFSTRFFDLHPHPRSSGELGGNLVYLLPACGDSIQIVGVVLEHKGEAANASTLETIRTLCSLYQVNLMVMERSWRKLPQSSAWARAKAEFELAILEFCRECEANAILLDRSMFIAESLIAEESPLAKRVFNSHPGLLQSGRFRNEGNKPTRNALRFKNNERHSWSGITIHQVTPVVDGGPVRTDHVFGIGDIHTEAHLRSRVYSGREAWCQWRALSSLPAFRPDWSRLSRLREAVRERMEKTACGVDEAAYAT